MLRKREQGRELKMETGEISETIAAPEKPQASPKKAASKAPAVDQYAAARYAKKKRRRKAHRAVLRRSHSNG
jgi:hypothetical protein